jgi:hypothetical protein
MIALRVQKRWRLASKATSHASVEEKKPFGKTKQYPLREPWEY